MSIVGLNRMCYGVFVFEPAIPDALRSLRDAGPQGQG